MRFETARPVELVLPPQSHIADRTRAVPFLLGEHESNLSRIVHGC